MAMPNLAAYIPVLNRRHLEWFKKHPASDLFLISQSEAERLLPRLSRNMAAIPTGMMARMIGLEGLVKSVRSGVGLEIGKSWILPDEDVSHLFAEEHLLPKGCEVFFEMIWARYDMAAVHQNQPVIPDVKVSSFEFDRDMMRKAQLIAGKSPDWWRQIGAVAVTPQGIVLASACNAHMPSEYETYIFGDPGLNRDAGQPGKYTSIHAEEAIVAFCAGEGVALREASVYVTTFPCEGCARRLAAAGVKRVFFKEGYSVLNAQDVLRAEGVEIIQVVENPLTA
jgi:dCMP deaminase